jgi:hypothetical protein
VSFREVTAAGEDAQRLDIRALMPPRLLPDLDEAVAAARRTGTGHEGVLGHLRTCHLAEHELQLCMLAYSLWRGVGPAFQVSSLWGMDARLATRLLAGIAAAVDPADPGALLDAAKGHLGEIEHPGEDTSDPPTD